MKQEPVKTECERRFLVHLADLPAAMPTPFRIEQCYLPDTGDWQVRARMTLRDGRRRHFVTMKRKISHGIAHEIEQDATEDTWLQFRLAAGKVLIKSRTELALSCGAMLELDRYEADLLNGMAIAEVELPCIDHPVTLPGWVGREVTGVSEYSNRSLFRRLEPVS